MSKPPVKKPEIGDKSEAILAERKAPGRTIGIVVMCAMILFVAIWMERQAPQIDGQQMADFTMNDSEVIGFRRDAWFLPDDDLSGFVRIPAGSFTMGSNPALDRLAYENERWSSARRQGSVDLADYYIGRFEVTTAQFKAFLQDVPTQAVPLERDQAGNNPVANITWPEALAYTRWLEQKLKSSAQTPAEIKQFLDEGAHVTLPSEAEWEKAARGIDARVFPWGSQVRPDLANYESSAVVAVGSVSCDECAYGLADMSGNVWELTRSPLQDYPYDPADDADSLSEDALWVMRGGSYADSINNLRAAVRGGVDPGVRNNTIGFRLVISKL